jgi:ubiquinone/menaquinone biosynthesis C-methylase UbiE
MTPVARIQLPDGVSAVYWRLLLSEPLSGAVVLDIGTGAGRIALALAPQCRRVVGVDRDTDAIDEARRRATELGITNVEFVVADADAVEYHSLVLALPRLVTAHLFMSDALVERSARVLPRGEVLTMLGFHVDHWRETGRSSRFAYDEPRMRRLLATHGFAVEHLEVERDVKTFGSVEEALAAAIGLEEKWKADGRWSHYIKFLEQGGRTLTQSHLIVKARRT